MIKLLLIVATVLICSVNAQVTLTVDKLLLNQSNEVVTISWTGLTTTSLYDCIAIYSPSNSSITHPIGFLPLSTQSPSSWKLGYGTASLPLLNAKADYLFRLWVPGTVKPTLNVIPNVSLELAATSPAVTFTNLNAPGKAYLSMTSQVNEMRLMWVSGTNNSVPTVFYGLSSDNLSQTATGISLTYTINDMCAAPANSTDYWRDPGYIHDAVMTGLSPLTKYYYYFGSDSDGWSDVYSFISPPLSGEGSEAFVIAYGDLGTNFPFIASVETQYPATETVQGIYNTISLPYNRNPFAKQLGLYRDDGDENQPFWNIHHIGDISYARGIGFVWGYFLDSMQPLTTQCSYMVTIGNHEYDYMEQPFKPSWSNYGTDSGGECGVPYQTRFHMPGGDDITTRNLWYSYNQGPIHYTVMSAEHDFLPGSPQYQWIVQDLENVDRTQTPWVVFSGHRPFYTSALQESEYNMTKYLLDSIEPLLMKYDVNLVLTGHVHVYVRTAGIYNYTMAPTDNDAPVHVVVGMAGNTYSVPWDGSDVTDGNGHENLPEYVIFRAIDYGFTRIYANMTSLYLEFVSNHRFLVHDSFWLQSKY
ncbi:hypothetical protein DLAC_08655 [Tieghemostelium lacteum]|uniref:Purple acid phosphatase n=1 Tax=Tieghemostelium lacteum TaxID=361077 RepID=A0A151Z7Z6_TIELA|nr:hypothetical protein DLAC_08655 [Tieghemostelium lacteum]|eukprot:KYQ90071.1 hypothetical protein DLAC_08655 [Tieghemostelium lacteum]